MELVQYDVAIIGAGPAGATAAILLARAGWSVALVEKQAFPRRKVCGECLAASNLPLLDALGIGTEFARAAGPELQRVELQRGASRALAKLPAAANPKHPWGRALGRETLDSVLLRQACKLGATLFQPWRLTSIEGDVGHWRCHLQAPNSGKVQTVSARMLIDAHGSWESLNGTQGPARKRRRSDLFAFKANFRHSALPEGVLPVLALDGGYGGIVVAEQGLTTLACCIRRDRLDTLRSAAPGLKAGAVVEAWIKQEIAAVGLALAQATRVGPWLSAGPLAPGIRLRADDRILRLGNAAGEAHPIIGEGMSMAMQSAWMLCALLLRADRRETTWQAAIARTYAAQWRREFAPRMRLAAVFAHLAMNPISAAPLLALARVWPSLLSLGARHGGKLKSAVQLADFPLTTGATP